MPVKMWGGKPHTIKLPTEGEELIVKDRLGRDDRRKIAKERASSIRIDMSDATRSQEVDVGEFAESIEFSLLMHAVIGGRVKDEDTGEWIKINDGNKEQILHSLDEPSLAKVRAELETLYPPEMTDDERLNSNGNSSSSTQDEPVQPAQT